MELKRSIILVLVTCQCMCIARQPAASAGYAPAVSTILQLAKRKQWLQAATSLEALELEVGSRNLTRAGPALCSVAVNTMARLREPAEASRYMHLLTPPGKKPPRAAMGALLKAHCLVADFPAAMRIFSSILRGQDKAGRDDGRLLNTLLRCCVRTGNMTAAGKALEMYGEKWVLDDASCLLVVRMLCLKLCVPEACEVACLMLHRTSAKGFEGTCTNSSGGDGKSGTGMGTKASGKTRKGGGTHAGGDSPEADAANRTRLAQASVLVEIAKASVLVGNLCVVQGLVSASARIMRDCAVSNVGVLQSTCGLTSCLHPL